MDITATHLVIIIGIIAISVVKAIDIVADHLSYKARLKAHVSDTAAIEKRAAPKAKKPDSTLFADLPAEQPTELYSRPETTFDRNMEALQKEQQGPSIQSSLAARRDSRTLPTVDPHFDGSMLASPVDHAAVQAYADSRLTVVDEMANTITNPSPRTVNLSPEQISAMKQQADEEEAYENRLISTDPAELAKHLLSEAALPLDIATPGVTPPERRELPQRIVYGKAADQQDHAAKLAEEAQARGRIVRGPIDEANAVVKAQVNARFAKAAKAIADGHGDNSITAHTLTPASLIDTTAAKEPFPTPRGRHRA